MPDRQIDITPETKIGALLSAYPALEEKLIEFAPAFAKLRNPILRKTIGKVATLRHAAEVGGVSIGIMINALRKEAGIAGQLPVEDSSSAGDRPLWSAPDRVTKTFDARPLLERGEHPVGIVMEHLGQIPAGEVYELITPFVPAPLLDMARQKGFQVWTQTVDTDCIKSYLTRI